MTHNALPISFLSDFGHADEFVGVVHGVLAKLAPESRVIDVGHGTPRGDVRAAALSLTRAIQYLPEGVALVVVDPGVGSERKALALETDWGFSSVRTTASCRRRWPWWAGRGSWSQSTIRRRGSPHPVRPSRPRVFALRGGPPRLG